MELGRAHVFSTYTLSTVFWVLNLKKRGIPRLEGIETYMDNSHNNPVWSSRGKEKWRVVKSVAFFFLGVTLFTLILCYGGCLPFLDYP